MDKLSELRESLTYVIPLQELLENEDILGEAVNRYIKKSLSHLDLVTNFIESEEVYHKTKNFRKAVVHFTSNLVSGPIIAVGIVGGIRTGQVEVAVITIIYANDIPVAIENATNKAFDIYDNVLDAILEFIFDGTASRIITNFLNSTYEKFLAPRNFKQICNSPEECQILQQDNFQILINGLSLFTPHPYPSYSKEYEFALAKKKELITKTSIASNSYNFMDEEYLKNIQDLKEQDQIIDQEEQKYQLALKLYKEDSKIKNEIFNSLFKSLNENLSFQLKQERNTFLNPNQSLNIAHIQKLSLQDINNININSKPYLLKALYFCEDYVLYDKDKQALFDKNTIKELEFNSSFYTIFISHKTKLNNTYLNARKELYKSIDEFKRLGFKDLENAYQTYINSLIVNKEINSKDETINKNKNKEINKNLNQDENSNQESDTKENTNSTKEQDFYLLSSHSKNLNHFILENKDKNKRIIFLNNASSMSNLIHIYDSHCDIFIKNESLLDIKRIEKEYDIKFKEFNTRVFFYEKLLLGAKENNEFSFEDKEENLLYYFKYDKEDLNSLGDLNIKYNNHNAKIKNYSLLEESLNIKLEPKELKKEIVYNNTSFNKISKEPLNESSSSAKEPCFITLYLKDEHNKPIANAKIIIKGFKHDEALRVVNLKRRSDEKGKIRFDKEKYFSDCYSFKVKLDESKAYFPTPLQNAKRIFNNYTHHKVGLILKFKAKDHLVYDGFNVYHYKGNELINSYMARSGTAKADNQKRSKKQIANYFYQDEKDKSKSGKAYFYYDDESIQDRFGTLPEGEYYLKINEIAKDTNPSFLKDYPFEIGKTWGRYCVRLYTDKECSKTFKEVKIKESNEKENKTSKKDKKEQSIIKDNLYLYSINEKGEFGSNGSIGMAQAQLLEDLSKQAKFVRSEGENIISLKVAYPEKIDNKIIFVGKVYE